MNAVHSNHKTLTELLDLSLKTPEVGAVNFNILHQLLAQVLKHVGLAEKTAVLNNDTNIHQHNGPSMNDLYEKVHNMEERLQVLNSFPTPKEIIEKSQGESVQFAAASTFQSIQLKKSVEANEEGVAKSLGLIDVMLDEMNDLKKSNKEMKQKFDDSMEKLSSELNELKETSMEMEEQLDKQGKHLDQVTEIVEQLPPAEEFEQFVTFPVVAQALVTGTLDVKSFKESGTRALEKLGGVFSRIDQLEEKIQRYESESTAKADKKEFEQVKRIVMEQINHRTRGASISFQDQIDNLTEQIDQLAGTADNETNALTTLQNSIIAVESKIKSLSQDMTSIADENRNYEKKLNQLCSSFETLNKEKANDEDTKKLIESKVDKAQLLLKVDQKDFENKLHEISDKFMEVLQRMNNSGDDWREMVKKLSDEIETKLDRDELEKIKNELEKRLKKLRKTVDEPQGRLGSKMQGDILMEGDEAAGLRRQLINYNCISCNRPIDVKHPFTPSNAYTSIPSGGEFPYNRTTRPYTTFELDQIRSHAKGLDPSHNGRACGGNYTMSYPHKGTRYTRLTHISELWTQDDSQNQMKSDPPAEVDLLGENGQIYKGRLPGLEESGSLSVQPQTANQSERPKSSINTRPRPKSAVPLSRRRRTINLRGLHERLTESKISEQ